MRPRHSILIVDDDPGFRDLYKTALRFEGFDVSTASNGVEALHAVESHPPSLVILDLNMPCLDGWSVLRELAAHEDTRSTPVIVVTGEDVARGAEQDVTVVKKPVAPETVLPLISRQLRAHR